MFIPPDFAKSDCISRPIFVSDQKIKIRSSESDRIINGLRFLDSENSSQGRLLLCLAPRRVHFDRPWTQAYEPVLTDSSLAAKSRAEALHVVLFSKSSRAHASRGIFFNQASEPMVLCVISYDT